jgi:hypothetical protein
MGSLPEEDLGQFCEGYSILQETQLLRIDVGIT